MSKLILSIFCFGIALGSQAQDHPAITSWLQNTTETGSYYVNGNETAIDNGILYNCQEISFSEEFVYVRTTGIPAYPTGPFNDNNPSQATDQNKIFKFPLNPTANTGNPDQTTGGNIGVFINGVALFDYRDGVAWNPNTNALCGGPGNAACPGGPMATNDWNRDAVPAEMDGFDCSKAHPAMGNYHHHQNPSAFKLDLEVVSDICNLYDADGLYVMDSTQHSPLIGFAYDGFPIYGAYGYKNTDGTGDIARIKSSYQLRNLTNRDQGPPTSGEFFLGYFREDYEYIAQTDEDFLDEHNGRFCVTPEYPDGTYAYFATVDENWNSAYPYVVGPTFYGERENRSVNAIDEETTIYIPSPVIDGISSASLDELNISIFPNPASDLLAIQLNGLVSKGYDVQLLDATGQVLRTSKIKEGSTIAYFDLQTLYKGLYWVVVSNKNGQQTIKKIVVD